MAAVAAVAAEWRRRRLWRRCGGSVAAVWQRWRRRCDEHQGEVSAIDPFKPRVSLMVLCVSVISRNHFVTKAGMSLFTATASKLICASPSHPRRSRCGQSEGTSMRLLSDA